MLNFLSRHRLLIVVIGVFLILVVATTISFFVPIYGEYCSKNEYTNAKECASYHIALTFFWQIIKSTNDYGGALTALATIVVACFTGTLWWAAAGQYDLLADQINLAREEFISTHRPIIRVRLVTVSAFGARFGVDNFMHGMEVEIEFVISNVGSTDATVVDSRYRVYCFNTPEPRNDSLFGELSQKIPEANITLAPGESKRLFVTTRITLKEPPAGEQILRQFSVENWRMHIIGQIDYRDKLDCKRQTGFLRELRPGGAFRRIEDSDYEYED